MIRYLLWINYFLIIFILGLNYINTIWSTLIYPVKHQITFSQHLSLKGPAVNMIIELWVSLQESLVDRTISAPIMMEWVGLGKIMHSRPRGEVTKIPKDQVWDSCQTTKENHLIIKKQDLTLTSKLTRLMRYASRTTKKWSTSMQMNLRRRTSGRGDPLILIIRSPWMEIWGNLYQKTRLLTQSSL